MIRGSIRAGTLQPVPEAAYENDRNADDNVSRASYLTSAIGQCNCAQALLFDSTYGALFKEKLGIKCEEVYSPKIVIEQMKKSFGVDNKKKCACDPYKYLIIDLDATKMPMQNVFTSMVPAVRKEIASSSDAKNLRILAYKSENKDQEVEKLCTAASVTFVLKPSSGDNVDDVFMDKMTTATHAKN
jgi:hypothetical protein